MGATYDEVVITLEEGQDLQEVYDSLVRAAERKYGNRGYTGSFAEKAGELNIVKPQVGGFWDEADARWHCQDFNDKYGPCSAYRIGPYTYLIGGLCSR